MNIFSPSLFSESIGCLPCCVAEECECALLIPPFAAPFTDYAVAESFVSNPFEVTDCLTFAFTDVSNATSASASFDGTTLSYSINFSPSTGTLGIWVSVTVAPGETISVSYTGGVTQRVRIYGCDGTLIETLGPSGGSLTSSVLSGGVYYLELLTSAGPPPFGTPFASASFSVTCSGVFTVNPVIALYDDSGTTRSLWACPKLLLPPLTESSGDWYANCAAADADIAAKASNCVGWSDYLNSPASFTATDGGTSLTLAETYSSGVFTSDGMWGSINAVAGQTLTFTSTVGAGTANVSWAIYDDTGAVVQSSGGIVASPSTSSALPYTGRYTVEVVSNSSVVTTSHSVQVTSSGTLSVNPIQARYDLGLGCAGLLDCGDSC